MIAHVLKMKGSIKRNEFFFMIALYAISRNFLELVVFAWFNYFGFTAVVMRYSE